MMCSCDERIGRKCLSHQLNCGVELETQERVQVTLGFQPRICRDCRGLPREAHPVAAIPGRTTKIRRYYWRELQIETLERFHDWSQSPDAAGRSDPERAERRAAIESEVLAELKELHSSSPKYKFKERPQSEIIKRCKVEVIELKAAYQRMPGQKSATVLDGTDACAVEEFVARQYRQEGYDALSMESRPLHVLFGVFLWPVIQDLDDPLIQPIAFGDHHAFDRGVAGELIHTWLPQDFGTAGYGRRRWYTVRKHLGLMSEERNELEWLFEYSLSHSESLRQYLWAHREKDIHTARHLIRIVSPTQLKTILRYLVRNYWERYLGWPDLLVYRKDGWFLAEVKSSGDKLSEEQKRWIQDNWRWLRLPFKLVKVIDKNA